MSRKILKLLFITIIFLSVSSVNAQKINGHYYPDKDSFAIIETPYSRSLFEVENPCVKGHCVIKGLNYQGLGVIDTAGFIIFEPQKNVNFIEIISTPTNLYFNYNSNNTSWLICKDKPNLSQKSEGRFIYLHSDSISDMFFEEEKSEYHSDYNVATGKLFHIFSNKTAILEQGKYLTETDLRGYEKANAEQYFYKGLLIHQNTDTKIFKINDLRNITYIHNSRITDIMNIETVTYISESLYGHGYELHSYAGKDTIIDKFESYTFERTPQEHLIFRKNGKTGCYISKPNYTSRNGSTNTLFYIPPIFDSLVVLQNYIGRYRGYIGDTTFVYNSMTENDTFDYRSAFAYATQKNKIGKQREIGRNGEFIRPKLANDYLGSLAPQSSWLGIGLNSRDVLRKSNNKDTVSINAFLLEGGIGWYSMESDGNLFLSSWELFGGGIGLEYRTPFMSKDSIESITGNKYNRTYLNARVEYATGLAFLIFPLSFHLQLGYSTNFKENFLRPGIGISFYNLLLGIDGNLKLKNTSQSLGEFGIYMRYIITDDSN